MKPAVYVLGLACAGLTAAVAAQGTQKPVPTTAVATIGSVSGSPSAASRPVAGIAVRITSPLGRTGATGTVRIVAQIQAHEGASLQPVKFLVDDQLLTTVEAGPPFAVDWTDDNPFKARRITVEVTDTDGHEARDEVALKPFEVTEATEVTSVLLETAVYDKEGQFISGLDAGNFSLRDDNVEQPIQLVSHETLPTTFAILVDSSQSMSRRFDFVQMAAEQIVHVMHPNDRIIVAPFGRTLRPVTGPTNDLQTVREAIAAIRAEGGTAIYDAIVELTQRFEGTEGRRAAVLITDGWDENSRLKLRDAIEAAKAAKITVYILAIGGVAGISLEGEDALRQLAGDTGGRAFFPAREAEISLAYTRLAADAQNRYLITYTPTNQRRDGRWHAVSLQTVPVSYRVKTRNGYFAPQPVPIRPTLEFTATDLQDHYVNISKEDLEVLENGVPQSVQAFAEAVTPVSIILAVDASGSMKKSAAQVMEAARGFVASLRPEDPLAMLVFADTVHVAHALATNRDWSVQAIDEYRAEGGTALYDALYGSLQMLRTVEGRRAVVVVTDGVDEDRASKGPGSARTLKDVLDMAKQVNATLFTVGVGSRVSRPILEQLASVSGGRTYFPSDAALLREQYQRIVENLRRRYVLTYTSTNAERDGAWRKVEIRARQASVQITSRTGYFAPDR